MSNTILIKGTETGVTSSSKLDYKELGFDFLNGDLYIGDKNSKPLLIAKGDILSKLQVVNGNLELDGTVIATNISIDTATLTKIIVKEPYRGTADPNTRNDLEKEEGLLYFRIV